jgi:hypothetical protein
VSKQRYPALKDHDPKSLVGTPTRSSPATPHRRRRHFRHRRAATEVVASADNGFTWGVSMGAIFGEMKLLPAGQSARVNGRTWMDLCISPAKVVCGN